jgi:hypothetical protein
MRAGENTFREQEAGGQLEIVTGSSHGKRNGFIANADFEGFFDGEKIEQRTGRVRFDALYRNGENTLFHRIQDNLFTVAELPNLGVRRDSGS